MEVLFLFGWILIFGNIIFMHCGGGGVVTKSSLTLATPWTVACQTPPSMGFSRQEYCSGLPFPSPRDLPDPGIEPRSPTLQADFLPTEPQGKPGWLGKSPKFLRTENYNQSSVQLLSHVQLFATPWTPACQASLSIANSQNLPKLMSTESVMPSNYLILCRPLPLLPSIFASIRIFSN